MKVHINRSGYKSPLIKVLPIQKFYKAVLLLLDVDSLTCSSNIVSFAQALLSSEEFQTTGIPQFTLLLWGHIKTAKSKNCVNQCPDQGYLVVLKGRKVG